MCGYWYSRVSSAGVVKLPRGAVVSVRGFLDPDFSSVGASSWSLQL